MISSRNLFDLDPIAHEICERHIYRCKAAGIELLITSTYRDLESQAELYALGRTNKPLGVLTRIVTNAKPGESWHNYRCAWDVVPMMMGKTDWVSRNPSGGLTPVWAKVVECGIKAGAEAAANWKTFREDAHFQIVPPQIDFAKAKVLFDQSGTIFPD